MAIAAGLYVENQTTTTIADQSYNLINEQVAFVQNETTYRSKSAEDFLEKLLDIANSYNPNVQIDYDPIGERGNELITLILDKIFDTIQNGGTGVNADVEAAIWAREQERAELANEEAKDTMSGEWARTGFSLPDGVLTTMFSEVDRKYQDSRLTTSRDIAIKTFELEQKNLFVMIEKAVAILSEMIKDATIIATTVAEEQVKAELGKNNLLAEIARAQASLQSQILSAILSSVNLGSHYSASGSASESASGSASLYAGGTTNVNHNYNHES